MKRVHFHAARISLALFSIAATDLSAQQSPKCTANELLAVLKSTDPVYQDASALMRTLTDRGFAVKCVLQSKMVNLFEGQKGAALYRTDRGDFEALFLSPPQNFNALEPVEHREGGRFIYSFRGTPEWRGAYPMDSAYRTYFIKRGGQLFVTSDESTAKSLDELNATASRVLLR